MTLTAPCPITVDHDTGNFSCGVASLDKWLRERALRNERTRASRCFVLCDANRVVGYYALAAGAVTHAGVTGRIRRNMPDPIPAIVLGRLAIDRAYQGRGLGRELLQDAVLRSLEAAKAIGARVLIVHAISPEARQFYLDCGFIASPANDMMLFFPFDSIGGV